MERSRFSSAGKNRTCLMPKEMDDIGYKDPTKTAGIGAFQIAEWVEDLETLELLAEQAYANCQATGYLDKLLTIDQKLWLPDDVNS